MAEDLTSPQDEATFTLKSGRIVKFAFKIKALMLLQARFAKPAEIVDGVRRPEPPPDINEIMALAKAGSIEHRVAMFWAGLQKYQPGLTIDEATDIVDELGGLIWLELQFLEVDKTLVPESRDKKELEEAAANAAESGGEAAAAAQNPSPAPAGSTGESLSSIPGGSA